MHNTEFPFKGRDDISHLVLDPDNTSNLQVVLRVARRVLTQEPPWDTPAAKEGVIKIITWFEDLMMQTSEKPVTSRTIPMEMAEWLAALAKESGRKPPANLG